MKRKELAICLCIIAMVAIVGCSPVSMIGIAAEGVALFAPNGKKKVNKDFIPKPNIDTKETIIHELGQPNDIIVIGTNKQVLSYGKRTMADLYALKNGVYQDTYLTTNLVVKRMSQNDFISIFPCFQETTFIAKPYSPECATEKQIISEQGRNPDDYFYCKGDAGELVPSAKVIAFYNNNAVLMIGINLNQDKIVQEKQYSLSAYRIYRHQTAYVASP